MKKILLFGIALFAVLGLYSNPNPSPEVHINEFMFTGTNHWTLEIYFYYCTPAYFDSITVQSNSGSAKVTNFQKDLVLYFTDQDLSRSLTINPAGDVIVLVAHSMSLGDVSCTLSFGNALNPDVPAPSATQSIARFESTNCLRNTSTPVEIFSLSAHPTPGVANDTTGTSGIVEGTIYDLDGQPIPNQTFYLDWPFTTDASGHYSARIFSRIFSWDSICYEKWSGHFSPAKISAISYTLVPDSVITRDIHLLTALLVGIPEPKKIVSGVNVFPNPVTDLITVSYSTGLSENPGDLNIEIYDMNGIKILNQDLENQQGIVKIPVKLINGMYVAILRGDGKIVGSTRFIVDPGK